MDFSTQPVDFDPFAEDTAGVGDISPAPVAASPHPSQPVLPPSPSETAQAPAKPIPPAPPVETQAPPVADNQSATPAPAPAPASYAPEQVDYQPDFPEGPGSSSAFVRGVVQGVGSSQQDLGGAAQVFNILSGGDANSTAGKVAAALNPPQAGPSAPGAYDRRVPTFHDVQDFSSLSDYIGETFGSGVASTVPSVAGGLAGGTVGSVAGPGGTVTGGFLGAAAPSIALGVGGMWNDLRQDPGVIDLQRSGKLSDKTLATWAAASGSVIGAIDAIGAERFLPKDVKDEAVKAAVKKVTLEAIKGSAGGVASEGFTEALQEIIGQTTQAVVGGNVDAGKRASQVLESFFGGALVGGAFGAGHGAHEAVAHNDHLTAHEADTPGVTTPVTAPDQSTPGGAGVVTAPPPVGEGAASAPVVPKDGSTVLPASSVEVTPAGAVASDVSTVLAPAPTGEVTPQPAPAATSGEAAQAAPGVTPELTTQAIDYQPEFANEGAVADDEDADPDVVDPDADEDGAAAPSTPAGVAHAEERAAAKAQVVPAGTDEQAALAAAIPPKPAATPAPEPQPAPVTPEVAQDVSPVAQPATSTVAGPVEPVPVQPSAGPDISQLQPIPGAAPVADVAPGVNPGEGNDDDALAAIQRRAVTEIPVAQEAAPATSSAAQPDVASEPIAPPLPHTPVSRGIVDEVRQQFSNNPIAEDPAFHGFLDKLARAAATTVRPGEPVAAAIRNRVSAVTKVLMTRVNEANAAKDVQEQARTAAADDRARAVADQRKVSGAPQERARDRQGNKPAAAVAAESDQATVRRAKKDATKPVAERNPQLQEYNQLYEARKNIKGGGKVNEEARAPLTRRMTAIKEVLASQQATKEEARPTKVVSKQVEDAAAVREKRNTEVSTAIKTVVEPTHTPEVFGKRAPVTAFVAKVKSALRVAKHQLSTTLSEHNSPEENLAILAQRALSHSDPDLTIDDMPVAKFFYDAGMNRDLVDLGHQSGVDEKTTSFDPAVHGVKAEDFATAKKASPTFDAIAAPEEPTSSGPMPEFHTESHEFLGRGTLESKTSLSASEALDLAVNLRPHPTGFLGMMRRMHIKKLKQLVGDTKVMFVSPQGMYGATGQNPRGAYYYYNNEGMAQGHRGVVLINGADYMASSPAERAHVIEHELTHAATVFAINNNYRNSATTVRAMMDELAKVFKELRISMDPTKAGGYGWTNVKEFVAEAFSDTRFQMLLSNIDMPEALARKIGMPQQKVTFWQAFKEMVRNALGMDLVGRKGQTYMDGVMHAIGDMYMSQDESEQRAREDFAGEMPLTNDYGPQVDPMSATDYLPMLADADHQLEATRIAKSSHWWSSVSRTVGSTLATTEELKRRVQSKFFENKSDNVFSRLANLVLSRDARVREIRKAGDALTSRLHQFSKTNPAEGELLSQVVHDSTIAQIDPSVPLSHPNNKHVSKKGDRGASQRNAWRKISAEYAKLGPDAKKIMADLGAHYKAQQDAKVRQVVNNIIEQGIDHDRIKPPAGVSQSDLADFVLNGGIDKEVTDMSPAEVAMNTALGNSGKALKGSKEMRLVKGFYAPLTRYGKYYFTAKQKVALPAGATEGTPTDDAQTFIFKDKKDRKRYLDSTDDQVSQVFSRATDPKTGLTADPKTGKAYTLGDSLDYEPYWYVRVINKSMEMDDSTANLAARKAKYDANGHTTTSIAELDKEQHAGGLVPAHIQRILTGIDNSKASDTIKKANRAGVVDAYIRTMAGSRAQQRQLKRVGIKGYSRDLVKSTFSSNTINSGHLANLQILPQMAKADAALDKHVNDMRYANAPDVLELQSAIKQLRARRDAAFKHGGPSFGKTLANAVLSISYLTHLASPMFSIMNATQPLAVTLPTLAGEHGMGATMRAMSGAFRDMGYLSNYGTGMAETVREGFGSFKRFGRPKEFSYHDDITNRLINGKDIQNRQLKLDTIEKLKELGYGTDGGLDITDMSELGKNKAEIALARAAKVASQLPQGVEAANRHLTALAAVDLAVKAGMDPSEIANYAASMVEKTQGGYASANNPNAFSHPLGKIALQFKKYGLMYGQLFYGALKRTFSANTPAERKTARRQLVNLTIASTILAGVGGNPLIEIARALVTSANLMGWLDDDWEDTENNIQGFMKSLLDHIHKGTWNAKVAEMLMHGASRGIGIDMSSRLGNDSLVLFGSPRSGKENDIKQFLWDTIAGAPGGVATDMFKFASTGDLSKAPLPKMLKDAVKGYQMATQDKTTASGATVLRKKSGVGFESLLTGLVGATPASTAEQYEFGGGAAQHKQDVKAKAERTSVMQSWLNASPAERARVWNKNIIPFNKGKVGKERISMDDLNRNAKRRASQQAK